MKGKLVDLQQAATNNRIALEEISMKDLEGWEGKPKGQLQVLWEWGWIDDTDSRAYTDFKEEETMLQAMASKKGVLVNCSPKCHAKLQEKALILGPFQRTTTKAFCLIENEERKIYKQHQILFVMNIDNKRESVFTVSKALHHGLSCAVADERRHDTKL